jgi:fermentation-respiration switch protein FrsA (DUF1100 family)
MSSSGSLKRPASFIIEITPDRFKLPFEDITLTTEDGVRINGWLILRPGAKSTILFFHGNAGNMSDRLMKLRFFYEMGVNTFIIDYRGYGRSQGTPSEGGVYRDGRAALRYLRSRSDIGKLPIVIYGGSLGGAVAIDVAVHQPVDGLIIDSAFPSAPAMSRLIYPMIPTFFLSVQFDSIKKIKILTVPKLFMHSTDDRIVPFHLGKQLFDAAPAPKEFTALTGGHNDAHIECREKFLGAIEGFLRTNGWL